LPPPDALISPRRSAARLGPSHPHACGDGAYSPRICPRTGSARPALTCTRAGPTQSLPFNKRATNQPTSAPELNATPHAVGRSRERQRWTRVACWRKCRSTERFRWYPLAPDAQTCTGTGLLAIDAQIRIEPGLTPPTSEPGLGSPPPTAAVRLGSPLPHLHLDTARSRPRPHQHCNSKATGLGAPRPTFVSRHGSPLEHVQQWAYPSRIFSGRESARPSHVCTGTGRAPAHGKMQYRADRAADGGCELHAVVHTEPRTAAGAAPWLIPASRAPREKFRNHPSNA
jgi:hypothetical protein